jgi:hypothetical protein
MQLTPGAYPDDNGAIHTTRLGVPHDYYSSLGLCDVLTDQTLQQFRDHERSGLLGRLLRHLLLQDGEFACVP